MVEEIFSCLFGVPLQGSIEEGFEVRRSCIRSRGHASGIMVEASDVVSGKEGDSRV